MPSQIDQQERKAQLRGRRPQKAFAAGFGVNANNITAVAPQRRNVIMALG